MSSKILGSRTALALLIVLLASIGLGAYQTVTLQETQRKLSEAEQTILSLEQQRTDLNARTEMLDRIIADLNSTIEALSREIANLTAIRLKITLVDLVPSQTSHGGVFGCSPGSGFAQGQTLEILFDLVNTGTADGFATVQMIVDRRPVLENTYFVPLGRTVTRSLSITVDNCDVHDINAEIKSVT